MTAQETKDGNHITLKEASERFGYAPDYIGQLIRKGKIEGKQVYANVAWVTTVEAMERYIAEEKGGRRAEKKKTMIERYGEWVAASKNAKAIEWMLRAILVVLAFCGILLFYFISIAIDRELLERAENRHKRELPARTEGIAVPAPQPTLLNHEAL